MQFEMKSYNIDMPTLCAWKKFETKKAQEKPSNLNIFANLKSAKTERKRSITFRQML